MTQEDNAGSAGAASPLRVLVMGDLSPASHTTFRAAAMERQPGVTIEHLVEHDPAYRRGSALLQSVAWRIRWPLDQHQANARLLAAAQRFKPDYVYMENVKTVRPGTIKRLRGMGVRIAYMSPDYITAPHNCSHWLRASFPLFDVVFNTKSYGIAPLRAAGARRAVLISNNFVPAIHRPMQPDEVGEEFEQFDLVFAGAYEKARAGTIVRLAEAGYTVLVHGSSPSRFDAGWGSLSHPNITVRPQAELEDYTRAMHRGKLALSFLRKRNLDQITCRSVEIPAMERLMLAEKTPDHDAHFVDGTEYVGFRDDDGLISRVETYLRDPEARASVARAGRRRCWTSRYDVDSVVAGMLDEMRSAMAERAQPEAATL